jgi:hypothetical protein
VADDSGACVREWTDVVRRARLGRTTKLVALLLANYADSDGTRVHPGIARLAVESELTYKVVQAALSALRRAGLIEVVRAATRRGHSDEYRLTLGVDLLERVEVLSPAEAALRIERIRSERYAMTHRTVSEPPSPEPTTRVTPDAERNPPEGFRQEVGGTHGVAPKSAAERTASSQRNPRRDPPPSITETQELPTTPTADLDAAVTGSRASPADDQGNRLPSKCSHGLPSRRTRDGTPSCALCRHEAGAIAAAPNVIPIRRPA